MRKHEIKVGGLYLAKVAGNITTVRVDAIREINVFVGEAMSGKQREQARYDVTNLKTGRKTTFRSAAKFRAPAVPKCTELTSQGFEEEVRSEEGTAPFVQSDSAPSEESSEEEDTCPFVEPTTETAATVTSTSSDSPTAAHRTDNTLAARIAATRGGRAVGTPVAGMVPNEEQEAILAAAVPPGLRALVVAAGAGTGKTATLKMLEEVLPGRGQYTAFNTSLVAESKAKFKRAACNTTHSLAFRAVGRTYQHRLGGERVQSHTVARILGIEPFAVTVPGQVDAAGNPKPKMLQAGFLAGQVLTAIRRFCQSAEREVGAAHLRYIDGIDAPAPDGRRGMENNERVREYLLPFCHKAWADLSSVDGVLPFNHDCYVKIWQLGQGNDRPVIAADYILLDEAQDTAPVLLDILKQQEHALLVLVGDDNQQIYEWRGAVNAMASFRGAPRCLLSQSYRFGQAIADVANAILRTLDEPTDLVMRGNPTVASRVEPVREPRCYLYRTNAGAIGRVMEAIERGRKPHLIGGGRDVIEWCGAAIELQEGRATRHPELACFDTWAQVVEYSKSDEGQELRLMVKLVETFGAARIRDALRGMPREEYADLIACTAHKSKGREWDTVRLGQDFPTANNMTDADRRLLYVAATRAKQVLDISECPPFCGGHVRRDGVEAWVPGIAVTYTRPVPPAADTAHGTPTPAAAASSPPADAAPAPDTARPPYATPAATGAVYGWLRHADRWCVRGPVGTAPGTRVTVRRRDGSTSVETVRGVAQKSSEAWVYTV